MSGSPRLAIVIPVYGHPMLVSEALQAALAQQAEFGIHIVVVNDGCPHPETDLVSSSFALAYPDRVTCLTKPNGGLSSARNAGIQHVLAHLPSVDALFMLDADNRLRPTAMACAMAKLDAHPDAGWVYPSIDMFGIPARCDYGGPYSRLIHSEMNVSEAGSLIRREVFEAGVMFDETFKHGFEDWHFFLSAGDAGFVGVNLEDFGFFYRKRPESMLADADRHRDALVAQLRAAHPVLYRPATLLRLEHEEAPRYAIWCAKRDEVRLVTDPEQPGSVLSGEEYARAFWHARTSPGQARVPPFLVVADAALLESLAAAGVLHWALWRLEVTTGEGMVRASLMPPTRKGELASQPAGPVPRPTALWMLGAEALIELLSGPEATDPEAPGEDGPSCAALTLRVDMPDLDLSEHKATDALRGALTVLHGAPWRAAGRRRWGWRQVSIGWRGKEHRILRKSFGGQPPLPRVSRSETGAGAEIGVITEDITNSALVDALVGLQAARADGARLTLFVMDDSTGPGVIALRDQVDAIALLGTPGFSGQDETRLYFNGVALPGPVRRELDDRALALLSGLDEVHSAACPGAVRLMGTLRREGARTYLHLSADPSGNEVMLTLAYEHAHDRILAPVSSSAQRLRAMGLPAGKLLVR